MADEVQQKPAPLFNLGDRVKIRLSRGMRGRIVELRGPLAIDCLGQLPSSVSRLAKLLHQAGKHLTIHPQQRVGSGFADGADGANGYDR